MLSPGSPWLHPMSHVFVFLSRKYILSRLVKNPVHIPCSWPVSFQEISYDSVPLNAQFDRCTLIIWHVSKSSKFSGHLRQRWRQRNLTFFVSCSISKSMLACSIKHPLPLAWSLRITCYLISSSRSSCFSIQRWFLEPEALSSPLVTAQEVELYCIGKTYGLMAAFLNISCIFF